jgi:hypothetical protein
MPNLAVVETKRITVQSSMTTLQQCLVPPSQARFDNVQTVAERKEGGDVGVNR